VQAKLEKLVDYVEWYTHSEDIRQYRAPDWELSNSIAEVDDDGDALDQYDYYFDEYDWETERDDLGRNSSGPHSVPKTLPEGFKKT
jgi:hypothetical protein